MHVSSMQKIVPSLWFDKDCEEAVNGYVTIFDGSPHQSAESKIIGTLTRIDRYVLLIHPLVLGSGRHLFRGGGPVVRLRLLDTQTTSTGVVMATYEPAPLRAPQARTRKACAS